MMTATKIVLSFASTAAFLAAADIWQQKPASEWSEKDCQKLVTKSPWAKESTLAFAGGSGPGPGGGMGGGRGGRGGRGGGGGGGGMGGMGGGGMPPMGGGGGGMGGGMGGMGGGGGMGGMGGGGGMDGGMPGGGGGGMGGGGGAPQMPKASVRWESAPVYRDAMKKLKAEGAAEADVEGFYVITVTGLRLGMGGRGGNSPSVEQLGRARERLKEMTSLVIKGREPIAPARVDGTPSPEGTTLRFYFPRSQEISLDDKEVQFETHMGPMELKTKFQLKDMVVNGKLKL